MRILKKVILLFIVLFTICSCSKEESAKSGDSAQINVTIADFELHQEYFTRAAVEDACSRITFSVFDSDTGEKVFNITQALSVVGEDNFGKISFPLFDGNYTLIAVGYRVASQTPVDTFAIIKSVNEVIMPNRYIFDTFCKVKKLSVNSSEVHNVSMNLDRVISQFTIISSDDVPENVCTISIKSSKGDVRLNPMTEGAVADVGVEKTIGVASGTPFSSSLNMFVSNEEQLMDIEIEGFDDHDNKVMSKSFKNVVMSRARRTIATGKMFSESMSAKLTVNDSWLEPNYIYF